MTKEPMFPILNDPCIKAIPWAAIASHEAQAQRNHSQTLNRLASRGGLSPCEAVAVMLDQPWRKMNDAWARAKLMCLVLDFEKAQAEKTAAA
jgi:hypothetical protein